MEKEEKEVNWMLLGYDCWREIFHWLTIQETHRARIVCKKWNEWIVEYKAFWPLEYPKYSLLYKNISSGRYKTTKIKLDHVCSWIGTDFTLGIICTKSLEEGPDGFWIYSKTSFELLYHYEGQFIIMKASKGFIILRDYNYNFWLLTFRHSYEPKESIVLEKTTKIIMGETYFRFEYPYFIVGSDIETKFPILINVETGSKLITRETFTSYNCQNQHLSQDYCIYVCQDHLASPYYFLVFKISNPKVLHLKIDVPNYTNSSLDNNMLFITFDAKEDYKTIWSFNLETKEKTVVEAKGHINLIDKLLITMGDLVSRDVYVWNSNYTELKRIEVHEFKVLNYYDRLKFNASLPFILLIGENGIQIYFSNWKIACKIPHQTYKDIKTDDDSTIYFLDYEDHHYYLISYDFSISQ